jgi:glutaconate CoA-transferase subunit A
MGVPYVPVIGLAGSDLLRNRDDMKLREDPFDPSVKTVVARALRPDAALLHGVWADRAGNVALGFPSDDLLLAEASRRVVVTVEEIVDELTPEQQATGTVLPSILVDAVAHAPFGAHPGRCADLYPQDDEHLIWYVQQAGSEEGFADYLQQTVFSSDSHRDYIERFVPDSWRNRTERELQRSPAVRGAR